MYKAFVRSHLDYCDIIYHIPSHINQSSLGVTLHSMMEKVERIQYQAALSISGAWHGSSRSKLYEELSWETLSERRMCRRILQIHKIFNNKNPSYLKNKLPPICRPVCRGNIRKYFHEITCKSNRHKNSFSLVQLLPGISLSNILMASHLLISLKTIQTVFFVLSPKVFSVNRIF